jgi:hypothetical protein
VGLRESVCLLFWTLKDEQDHACWSQTMLRLAGRRTINPKRERHVCAFYRLPSSNYMRVCALQVREYTPRISSIWVFSSLVLPREFANGGVDLKQETFAFGVGGMVGNSACVSRARCCHRLLVSATCHRARINAAPHEFKRGSLSRTSRGRASRVHLWPRHGWQ